jgi:hypothetical protein
MPDSDEESDMDLDLDSSPEYHLDLLQEEEAEDDAFMTSEMN